MTMFFHWCSMVIVADGGQETLMTGKARVEDAVARVMANFAAPVMADFPGRVSVPLGTLGRKAKPKAKARTGHKAREKTARQRVRHYTKHQTPARF